MPKDKGLFACRCSSEIDVSRTCEHRLCLCAQISEAAGRLSVITYAGQALFNLVIFELDFSHGSDMRLSVVLQVTLGVWLHHPVQA
jgi:hypothetical protein